MLKFPPELKLISWFEILVTNNNITRTGSSLFTHYASKPQYGHVQVAMVCTRLLHVYRDEWDVVVGRELEYAREKPTRRTPTLLLHILRDNTIVGCIHVRTYMYMRTSQDIENNIIGDKGPLGSSVSSTGHRYLNKAMDVEWLLHVEAQGARINIFMDAKFCYFSLMVMRVMKFGTLQKYQPTIQYSKHQ